MVGRRISQQIAAAGGTSPYAFSCGGTLPPGLTLSADGAISGTPTTGAATRFTITATDSSPPADNGSQSYTLQVAPPVTITLSPATLPAAMAGVAVSQQHRRRGGTPPSPSRRRDPAARADPVRRRGHQRDPDHCGQLQVHDHGDRLLASPNKGSRSYTLQVAPVTVTIPCIPPRYPMAPVHVIHQTITASGGQRRTASRCRRLATAWAFALSHRGSLAEARK